MLKAALARMNSEFANTELKQGQDYQSQGYVLNIRLSDGLIKGRVKGQAGHIYDVHLDLKSWPSTPARCSCPYGRNCKHAAACLLALQVRENMGPSIQPSHVLPSQVYSTSNPVIQYDANEVEWYSELHERQHDFFAYQLGIMVDGQAINIVPLITHFIGRLDIATLDSLPNQKLIKLPLTANKVLNIELGRLKPLLRVLLQYSFSQLIQATDLPIRQYQLLLMQEAELAIAATASRWQATAVIGERLQALLHLNTLPAVIPPVGLMTQLRDYQQLGLNWLQSLRVNQFSGILADDMGLGKTIQTLAHLQYEQEQGRMKAASLIIAPTSLVGNWLEEAQRFTPQLKILIFHGADRQDNFDDYDVVISTYGLLQRDKSRFLRYVFYYIILDEAQFIKNFRAKTTQIVQQLQATHRLCLTGTPLENHLGELWSLFHFLMPGLLGTAKQFRQFFRLPIEKDHDMARQTLLNRRIQPFILRRTKQQVTHELPAKTEITHLIELIGPQRDLYEAIRLSMEHKVRSAIAKKGLGQSQIVLLDALLKLRQICCDPRLLSMPEAVMAHGHSAKLFALMALLDNLMEEGRRVLVFSQFTSMLKLIEEQLINRGYDYFKLTGKTQNRQALVQAFQQGEAPIFLISLKAGGVGLNLTRADTVILYDPWWNPAVQDQATDRSHRIGQENPVFVYKLIAKGTVEEVIMTMQASKRQLFNGLLAQQNSGGIGLTEADIAHFFEFNMDQKN